MNEHASARVRAAAALFVLTAVAAAWLGAHAANAARDAQAQSNANTQQPQAGQQPPQENPAFAELHKRVAGKENTPAEQVFTNVQVLKGVPAQRFLQIMGAYTRALGVRCDYCHVFGEWAKDDKETKQTARDMVRMTAGINDNLKKIKTIAADNPSVNCTTCHRGQAKPAPGTGPRPDNGQRPQGAPPSTQPPSN